MKGKLYSIGVGPGDSGYLTLKAKAIIDSADIIAIPVKKIGEVSTAYSIVMGAVDLSGKQKLELQFLMDKNIDVRKESRSDAIDKIVEKLDEGKVIAMITLGDVSIYSTCTYVNNVVKELGYDCEIISGIPSFCAGAAKACVSLCEGDESLAIVPAVSMSDKFEDIIDLFDNIVIMKAKSTMNEIYSVLEKRGLTDNAIVMSRVGMSDEIIARIDLEEDYSYFTTVLVSKNRKIV